MIDIRMIV